MKYTKKHNKTKYSKKRRTMKNKKIMKNKKTGGFTTNVGFGINGLGLNKQSGHKVYDWKSGKWLNQDCYEFMGIKHCTQPHE